MYLNNLIYVAKYLTLHSYFFYIYLFIVQNWHPTINAWLNVLLCGGNAKLRLIFNKNIKGINHQIKTA